MTGPLSGLRIVELGGIGPGPFAAVQLADLGAEVVRVVRTAEELAAESDDLLNRGKRGIVADLKNPDDLETVRTLIDGADALIEGFRPGVAERLGLGPEESLARNPALVYGRMTGWGRGGPLSSSAGHDINFISVAGALHGIGPAGGAPVPPLAYVGDFGGGAMSLAFGIVSALWERSVSGRGQVVDASIVDGVAMLTLPTRNFLSRGEWIEQRGSNLLDGGAASYTVYETSDGRHISVGPLEPAFYTQLLDALGLDSTDADLFDRKAWPAMRESIAAVFATATMDEWNERLGGTDVCFAPVLTLTEAQSHPHNVQRGVFAEVDGRVQPVPTPRFSRNGPVTAGRMTVGDARQLAAEWVATTPAGTEN